MLPTAAAPALLLIAAAAAAASAPPVPLLLPRTGTNRYVYPTRAAASAACANASLQLCAEHQLVNHSQCEAGWLADGEGYWMDKATPSCGGAGFNSWSGSAAAYCCPLPPGPGTPGRPRVVAWFDFQAEYTKGFPSADIDLSIVSHIVAASVPVAANGTCSCNPSFKTDTASLYGQLYRRVRAWGALHEEAPVKLLASFSAPPASILTNATNRANFLASVLAAVTECDVDGMEFDYEGLATAAAADVFTQLLIGIKATVCAGTADIEDCGFVISADSEPPQWSDYYRLNASKIDGHNIDYVNYMSYFKGSPSGDISEWNQVRLFRRASFNPKPLLVRETTLSPARADVCGLRCSRSRCCSRKGTHPPLSRSPFLTSLETRHGRICVAAARTSLRSRTTAAARLSLASS